MIHNVNQNVLMNLETFYLNKIQISRVYIFPA